MKIVCLRGVSIRSSEWSDVKNIFVILGNDRYWFGEKQKMPFRVDNWVERLFVGIMLSCVQDSSSCKGSPLRVKVS